MKKVKQPPGIVFPLMQDGIMGTEISSLPRTDQLMTIIRILGPSPHRFLFFLRKRNKQPHLNAEQIRRELTEARPGGTFPTEKSGKFTLTPGWGTAPGSLLLGGAKSGKETDAFRDVHGKRDELRGKVKWTLLKKLFNGIYRRKVKNKRECGTRFFDIGFPLRFMDIFQDSCRFRALCWKSSSV